MSVGLFANVLNVLNDQARTGTTAVIPPYDPECNPNVRECLPPGGIRYSHSTLFGRRFQLGFRFAFPGASSGGGSSRSYRRTPPPRVAPDPSTSSEPSGDTGSSSEPQPAPAPSAGGRIRGRTLVGDVVSIDRTAGALTIDLGLGGHRRVVLTDATRIRGGELRTGQRVRVRLDIQTRSRQVATHIRILD